MAARRLTLAALKRTAPPTLSPEETAPWLGVSRSTLYESIKNGTCPVRTIRVQRRIRVLTSSLIQLLESGDGDAPAA
jgi:excisionase family DNA binding protein